MGIARYPKQIPGWYREAAEVMARNACGLKQAADEIGKELTMQECEFLMRRKEFQEIVAEEEQRFRNSVAVRPGRSKATAIGLLLLSIEKLYKQGEYDKVAAAVEKLGKLEGWTNGDQNVNIFQGITAKDIEEQKRKIQEEIEEVRGSAPELRPN
jgi:hypothetical protein